MVVRPGSGQVLTVAGRLPAAEVEGRVWYATAAKVIAAFTPALDPILLRLLSIEEEEGERLVSATLLATLRGAEPEGAAWVDRDEVPGTVALLDGAGPARQPWAEPDWFPEAEVWLRSNVDGAEVTGPVQQHKVWELSCVLRVPTTDGDVYFKSTVESPLFVAEATVTALLAGLFPAHVPAPLAVEPERGWIATADFGAELGWEAPLPVRMEALHQYAALQSASTEHVPALLAAGCVDRRPAWLAAQLPTWFAADTTRHWARPELATALAGAVPRLVELCAELAGSPLPDTLLHGDMHGERRAAPGWRLLLLRLDRRGRRPPVRRHDRDRAGGRRGQPERAAGHLHRKVAADGARSAGPARRHRPAGRPRLAKRGGDRVEEVGPGRRRLRRQVEHGDPGGPQRRQVAGEGRVAGVVGVGPG